ncbi:MAG: hypothetical protein AB9836_04835 [Aminipila sp.]
MSKGREIIAIVSVENNKPKVEVLNSNFEVAITKGGTVCIVESKSQEFIAVD